MLSHTQVCRVTIRSVSAQVHTDQDSGKAFYFNPVTRQTTWSNPDSPQPPPAKATDQAMEREEGHLTSSTSSQVRLLRSVLYTPSTHTLTCSMIGPPARFPVVGRSCLMKSQGGSFPATTPHEPRHGMHRSHCPHPHPRHLQVPQLAGSIATDRYDPAKCHSKT